ncbi:TetR/AcrR family transcriptional regulator [Klenkia sp. PcliD-1-E]|uniref:TetR/AcrR family transcriptional regulator n=1 Tax=Klenkia sp. PcliD-1-E TaxID=2954492 RepID=UPI0020978442|nr:TetR/AcrR family transcriptional regulator [Klenkia sp. PcliD-1-E]MCO7218557.1 TetR/AcrR family transcriptional regulator [Klenkia sp. PcliD-1-E]
MSSARTSDTIREAARDLFYEKGYEATSLREVAAAVGVKVSSLYNHIDGKQSLLVSMMDAIMGDLGRAQADALANRTDSLDRLRAVLDCHVRFHAERAQDVFIGNSELRSLHAEARGKIVALRDAYERQISAAIAAACSEAGVELIDLRLQTYAVVAAGSHVSAWYRPGGTMTLDEIVDIYTTMAFRQLGLQPAA